MRFSAKSEDLDQTAPEQICDFLPHNVENNELALNCQRSTQQILCLQNLIKDIKLRIQRLKSIQCSICTLTLFRLDTRFGDICKQSRPSSVCRIWHLIKFNTVFTGFYTKYHRDTAHFSGVNRYV